MSINFEREVDLDVIRTQHSASLGYPNIRPTKVSLFSLKYLFGIK